MPIDLVVAVTDDNWFDLLRRRPDLDEVNFWAPSGANFRALDPGELFLFKLHAPRNVIVGGDGAIGVRLELRERRIATNRTCHPVLLDHQALAIHRAEQGSGP
jgi:hypothetical protein